MTRDGMIAGYRRLLAIPDVRGFFLPGLVARFPLAMRPIGCILLVSGLTGSYALAGATSAALTVAQAIASPRLGWLADRLGQRRVLLPALAGHALGLASLILAAQLGAPVWLLLVTAALAGATVAPVNAMVLARWTHVIRRRATPGDEGALLGRAYALENVGTEVFFVVGPFLVTLLALGLFPAAGLLAALLLTVAGGVPLAAHHPSEPPPVASGSATGALRVTGLRVIMLSFIGSATLFGAIEVGLVAFADEQGRPALAGLLISLFAVGSLVAALTYGARQWRWPPERRFALAVGWLTAGTVPILLAPDLPWMALAVIVAGVAIAPAVIAGSTLIEALVPPAVLTESFAWYTTATAIGLAVGAAGAGWLVDGYGSRAAFAVASAGGAVSLAVVLAGGRWLTTGATGDRRGGG